MSFDPILEHGVIPDFYADDLGRIDMLAGGNIRLVFYTLERGERVASVRVVGPLKDLAARLNELMSQAKAVRYQEEEHVH